MEENFAEGKKEKEESCRPLIRDAGRYGLDGTSGQELREFNRLYKRLDDLYIISADISITTGSKPWKERTTGKEYWGAYASIVYAVTDGNSRYRNDQFAKKYEFDNPFASAETLDMADDSLPF